MGAVVPNHVVAPTSCLVLEVNTMPSEILFWVPEVDAFAVGFVARGRIHGDDNETNTKFVCCVWASAILVMAESNF